jgi:hypothetical protein
MRRRLAALVASAALAAAGCGTGRSPVHGRVTYDDGAPVPAGTVIGEATVGGKAVSVQGTIGPDGRFSWGADRPGDGALPGTYRVVVMPVPPGDAERAAGKRPAVDGKYTRFETSGITFEVKPGSNDFPITVARPKAKLAPAEKDD